MVCTLHLDLSVCLSSYVHYIATLQVHNKYRRSSAVAVIADRTA